MLSSLINPKFECYPVREALVELDHHADTPIDLAVLDGHQSGRGLRAQTCMCVCEQFFAPQALACARLWYLAK